MSDEQIVEQLVAAREAGDLPQARAAFAIFAFRHFDRLKWRAKGKLKNLDDAEDVAQQTMQGVLKAAFDGESVGEAVSLMNTILERRVADYHRSRKGKETQSLPEELGDEDKHGPDAAVEDDETGRILVQDAIDRTYAKITNEAHRMAIDLKVFQRYSAIEAAEMVNEAFPDLDPPMSDQNADKIASRFRNDLRRELGGGD